MLNPYRELYVAPKQQKFVPQDLIYIPDWAKGNNYKIILSSTNFKNLVIWQKYQKHFIFIKSISTVTGTAVIYIPENCDNILEIYYDC